MKIIEITQEIRRTSRADGRPYVHFRLTREDGKLFSFAIPCGAVDSAPKWNNALVIANSEAREAGFDIDWIEIRKRFHQLAKSEV